jgi:hypothetical protein
VKHYFSDPNILDVTDIDTLEVAAMMNNYFINKNEPTADYSPSNEKSNWESRV